MIYIICFTDKEGVAHNLQIIRCYHFYRNFHITDCHRMLWWIFVELLHLPPICDCKWGTCSSFRILVCVLPYMSKTKMKHTHLSRIWATSLLNGKTFLILQEYFFYFLCHWPCNDYGLYTLFKLKKKIDNRQNCKGSPDLIEFDNCCGVNSSLSIYQWDVMGWDVGEKRTVAHHHWRFPLHRYLVSNYLQE